MSDTKDLEYLSAGYSSVNQIQFCQVYINVSWSGYSLVSHSKEYNMLNFFNYCGNVWGSDVPAPSGPYRCCPVHCTDPVKVATFCRYF